MSLNSGEIYFYDDKDRLWQKGASGDILIIETYFAVTQLYWSGRKLMLEVEFKDVFGKISRARLNRGKLLDKYPVEEFLYGKGVPYIKNPWYLCDYMLSVRYQR